MIESTNELQNLIDYLSNITVVMLDIPKDSIYKELLKQNNLETIKNFSTERNLKLLCISKIDQEGGGEPGAREILLETDLSYKGGKSATICLIKKDNLTLDLENKSSLHQQFQILNFSSESNDMNVFLYMQNYIQNAFSPLFNSYQTALSGSDIKSSNNQNNTNNTTNSNNIKSTTLQTVQNKINELVFILNQSQKNSEIPNIKLECEPELRQRIQEIRQKSQRDPAIEDFNDKINEDYIIKLVDTINRWKIDVSSVLKLDRQITQGNTLQEINFWKDYETTLTNIQKQLESHEVQMTLKIVRNARRFFVTQSFEEDTKMEDSIRRANSYNTLLKDLPIVSLTTTNTITNITTYLKRIFEYLRTKMKISSYPVSRTYQLIEVLSRDLNVHLLDILNNSGNSNGIGSYNVNIILDSKITAMDYKEFKPLYKELKELFTTWTKEFDMTKKEIGVWQRSRGERTFTTIPNSFEHQTLEKRIYDIKKFRKEHNNLKEITQSLTGNDNDDTNSNSSSTNSSNSSYLTKEIDQAYQQVCIINILDLTKEGEILWCNVRNEYNKKTEKIESQISNFLCDKLGSAQNPNEQFRIFAKFNKLITRQRIQNAIQEYQSQLVNNILNSLKDLKNNLLIGYQSNSASFMSKLRGVPDVSGHVIWLRQFQRKLTLYQEKMRMVLGEGWETHNDGKNVKDIITTLMKTVSNSNKIVEVWSKDIFNIENYNSERVLEIASKNQNYELRVNFDDKIIDLSKEVRLISSMSIFTINQFIMNKANDIKNFYPIAISLQDSIRSFNKTNLKIKNENRIAKLVAKSRKEIHDLIGANISATWGAFPKVERFSKDLCEKISSFEENTRDLVQKTDSIYNIFNQISKSDLNKDLIQDKITQIQKVIDEINDASNMQIWINEMDTKLESILTRKLEEVIETFTKEFTQFGINESPILIKEASVHKVKLRDQLIYLEPSVNEAREYWYSQLHTAIAIVCQSKRLEYRLEANFNRDNTINKETTYRTVLKQISATVLKNCYGTLEKKLDECNDYVKTWLSYQVLWDIQPKSIYEKLEDDMEKWQNLMNELRAGRKTFDNAETEKQFGAIFIDYSMVQSKINNKYDAWHKEIMNKFASTLNDNMKVFFQMIYNSRTNLENSSLDNTSIDIVTFITEVQETKKSLKTWQGDMDKYKAGKKILDKQRFHFPTDFCNLDQLESEWSKFKQILNKKSKSMEEQIPAIQARILADENVITEKLKELELFWSSKRPDKADTPTDALNTLAMANNMMKRLKDDYVRNCRAKELLEMEFSDPAKLDNLEEEIKDLKEVWSNLNTVWVKIEKHSDTPFIAIIPEKIKNELQEALNELGLFPNKMRTYEAYETVKAKLNHLKKVNLIVQDIRTDAIKERHWRQILIKLIIRKNISEILLGDFWKNTEILKNEKFLRDIISTAQGELVLENFLKTSKEFWTQFELEMVRYKDKCKLIKGWDDLFAKLDEHINSFQSMHNSPFYNIFKDEIEPWKDKLEKIRLLFNEWIDVQRRYVYLEGIFFGSAEIMNELASDYNKFKSIDNEFTGLMKKVASKPLILEVISIPSIKSILEEKLKSALERIQKSLYNFLEKQRQNFARFYFIGDEDLLEIIGNSKDIFKIQRHFNKMFAGLSQLISPDGNDITHMTSREMEEVEFEKSIKISDDPTVYIWLGKIEEQMRITLALKLEKAVIEISQMDYIRNKDDFIKWIEKYPAQITVLSSQVLWSASIESALSKKNLIPSLSENFTLQDEENVILSQLSALSDQVLKDIKVDMRKKLEQLITELVHQRDVTRSLNLSKVDSPNAFDWLYYMRFYFQPKCSDVLKRLQIKMSNASFDYGFEYLGVAEKLIQTPLTDRCYLTLTQALYFRLGGSPFGPAGTGKTESVKALGGQLGRFVLVFNCDETFDFKAMGRIFVGLCQVGAWGCFDEFNRLEERILSAVSQQILIIQLGLREYSTQIELMGQTIKLNHQMGTFVTMNPGYAGRSQLPDNLKQLFRQMAMVKPDKDMIAQVTLYSQGYKTAERLSGKMVSLFELCQNQLSSQSHYDFGLRALKSVLVNAGNLKRREDKNNAKNILENDKINEKNPNNPNNITNINELFEQNILIKSVCDTLIPKLVADDIALYNNLLTGVFPDAVVVDVKEDLLRNKIIELCKIRNLLADDKFIDKIIQLYSIQKMHHGVMMVGSSGTGKSAAWKILLEALQYVDNIKGESYIIDPKAVNKDNLYGKLDQTTLDWTDGVFTGILRKIIDNQRGESQKRHWIIFDGDVDPEWAENLNSVLDDNKLLTLPHGDRLGVPPNVRIMFEVESLKYATLATVSRCGMVWFSEDIVSTDMVFQHYLMRISQNNYDDVMNYNNFPIGQIDNTNDIRKNDININSRLKCVECVRCLFQENGFVHQALDISQKYIHVMEFTRIRVTESMFALLRKGVSNVLEYNENHSEYPMTDDQIQQYLSKWVCHSIIWGFGGSLSLDQRTDLSNKLVEISNGSIDFPYIDNTNSLIDYEVKIGENIWSLWKKKVPNTDIDTNKVSDADVVITTVDTTRHQEILCSWISEHRPFILCGPPGSGKTMTLMATLKVLTDYEMVFINFSSSTTPELILKTFDHYCEYKKSPYGTILRPKQGNKWMVLFCDEINLPDVDKYQTQIVITFLREITEQNGFWRPHDKQWITLERIQFVGACNPPSDVGRHPLNNRFLRHCPLLYVDFPGKDSLKQIYGTFNRAILRKGVPEVRNHHEALTDAMVEFYTRCQKHYTPDSQPHYIYSPRELTRWKHALNESVESINSVEDLVRLWAHEALRLFQDRLVFNEEKEWCDKLVDELGFKYFENLKPDALMRPILFTNLISQRYVNVDKEELIKNIEGKLKIFYEEELNVPLVIFDSVLEHILRIDRVLKQPIGHLLLVGSSGVGKTTLSRFVAWMNNLTVFQIKAGRNYAVQDFDDDLRSIMKRAGCKMEKICFIFDESNVLGPAFLERMNALLASGEVPGLFEGEEYMSLISSAKEHMNKNVDTEEEIYKQFIKNVQRNLHVVFTMNPMSPDFSNRAASSPALYNRCVIDWFGDWSREGLWQVAKKLTEFVELRNENFSIRSDDFESMHNLIVDSITNFHIQVKDLNNKLMKSQKKFNYITPRDFLDFIKHFIQLQKEKSEELLEQQVHINKGLNKIIETEELVHNMKLTLSDKEIELQLKQIETKAKFEKIMEDTEKARKTKEQAEKQKLVIGKMKIDIAERTQKVEKQLSEAQPKMEEAKNAVANMPNKYIAEIRGINKPTQNTQPTLTILGVIYNYMATKKFNSKMEWEEVRKNIMKADFINVIKNLNGDDVPEVLTKYVKSIILDGKWDLAVIKNASTAVHIMASWIEATIMYSEIVQSVQPLTDEITELALEKDRVEKEFEIIVEEIKKQEENIQILKVNYEQSVVASNLLKKEMEEVKSKVERSEKLLENLSSEKVRWSEQMSEFQNHINNLLGDTFLTSSFLAYIGFYDAFYRKSLKLSARDILIENSIIYTDNLDEVDFLTKPSDRIIWQKCNLPADNICLENATILERFNKYPLIIDPAGQATEFLKNYFQHQKKKLNTTSFSDSNFLKTLESALRFGYPILVQDVEKIDPIMNSLLNKEIHKTGGRNLIRIGDQEIDFSQSFNMFMVTRDNSCQFTPDLCSRVTFLNFTITPSSLQNQILSLILKSERPEVDKAKEDVVRAQREFKLQLRELEESLLQALNSEGNLLENDKVMSQLEEIKKKSNEINKEVSRTEDVMRELEMTTNEYLSIATMASRIYFALDSLEHIHYLYRFSLNSFMEILNFVIKSKELEKINKTNHLQRQEFIIKELFTEVYHRISHSLLNKDQIIFAMRLAQIRLNDVHKNEVNIILKMSSQSGVIVNVDHISEGLIGGNIKLTIDQRKQIAELTKIEKFANLLEDINNNNSDWSNFMNDQNAELCVPVNFINFNSTKENNNILEEICRIIILQVFRPDRMLNSVKNFLKFVFDEKFVNVPELDLVKVVELESNCKTPILFCSAPGHDASNKIEALAKKLNKRFLAIAIGSSEGFDLVEKNFPQKIKSGDWLVLKNVHLAPHWLNELEKKLYTNEPDSKFRLFLTMEFNPKIPANVLRISRKFVFELPAGIKHSMIRSYNNVITSVKSEKAPFERCRLHFLLAWFHAVIGERLRYVPIGWSKYYEFNESDQKCAMDAIDEWIDIFGKDKTNIDPDKIPWDAIRTIVTQSMYGGKIDNEYDLKVLDSLVNLYFTRKAYDLSYPLFKSANSEVTQVLNVPECRNNQGYLDWIDTLPVVESPEWSGLPNNAEKLLREVDMRRFIVEMNKIQGDEDEELIDSSHKEIKESWIVQVEIKSKRFFETLPDKVNILNDKSTDNINPIFRFLKREITVINKLLKKVLHDLKNIIEMCKGGVKSTNELREIARDIQLDTVPKSWRVYITAELSITEWIVDFRNRILQLNKISIQKDFGKSNIWLGGLIFPEAYLTATRQYVAQNLKLPLDELTLTVEMNKNCEHSLLQVNDFVISGMCLEGAEWSYEDDLLIMTDNLYYQMPCVILRWNKKVEKIEKVFDVPVYMNNSRKNLLFSVMISNSSKLTDADWYQRGIALISWNKTFDYK